MNRTVNQRPPIRWMAILFAAALNMILVTIADYAIQQWALATMLSALIRIVAPLLAGVLTALYTGERGGIHAFAGGLLSVPLLAVLILPGAWRVSLLMGILCGFGGAFTEFMRKRS